MGCASREAACTPCALLTAFCTQGPVTAQWTSDFSSSLTQMEDMSERILREKVVIIENNMYKEGIVLHPAQETMQHGL